MKNNNSWLFDLLYIIALIVIFPFAVVFDVMKRG